jgi:adenylate kinase family enzyme
MPNEAESKTLPFLGKGILRCSAESIRHPNRSSRFGFDCVSDEALKFLTGRIRNLWKSGTVSNQVHSLSDAITLRIHITGASGSGTTTLGRTLAEAYGLKHFDTDDYFWIATDPPYQQIRPREERLALLEPVVTRHNRWILSGALDGWGDPLCRLFDLVVFLYVPQGIRLERLRQREIRRYGAESIEPGGRMHDQYNEFIAWAGRYDAGDESVRSLLRQERWLETLQCSVIRLEGDMTIEERMTRIAEHGCFQPLSEMRPNGRL